MEAELGVAIILILVGRWRIGWIDLTIYFHINNHKIYKHCAFSCFQMLTPIQLLLDNNQMSNQQRVIGRSDSDNGNKKTKKVSHEDTLESAKKVNKKIDNSQNLITKYMKMGDANLKTHINRENKQEIPNPIQPKYYEQQEKLRHKDRQIEQLKNLKQSETNKVNTVLYDCREFKKRSRPQLAKQMLQLQELKRKERHRKQDKLGYFTQNMRIFVEGEIITSLRTTISERQEKFRQLQEKKKSKLVSQEEIVRVNSAHDFVFRELNQLKKQLKYRQKEIASYKDRLKLADKQVRSLYYRMGWPVVYERYQTLQLLGSGGFGDVYKCYDFDQNRFVALKFVTFNTQNGSYSDRQEILRKIQRQADIQKQLNHPNIVSLYNIVDIDKDSGKAVFELQYCCGIELSVYLRKQECIQQKIARLFIRQLFSAINYLYQLKQRVIHYDLKPSNIMICDGVIKILDFGLCKVMTDSEQSKMELTSQGYGTYWYLPPETFSLNNPKVSCKVDVWSLGVIFYELLYGVKPFGAGISQNEIYEKDLITKQAIKIVFPKQNPKKMDVSEGAKKFISFCLKYDPQERPTPQQAYKHPYLKKDD